MVGNQEYRTIENPKGYIKTEDDITANVSNREDSYVKLSREHYFGCFCTAIDVSNSVLAIYEITDETNEVRESI